LTTKEFSRKLHGKLETQQKLENRRAGPCKRYIANCALGFDDGKAKLGDIGTAPARHQFELNERGTARSEIADFQAQELAEGEGCFDQATIVRGSVAVSFLLGPE
jgi:hypothetical protein